MEEKRKAFPEIHEMLGGNIKLFISGAAALDLCGLHMQLCG